MNPILTPETLASIKTLARAAIGRNNGLLAVQGAPPKEHVSLLPEYVLALAEAADASTSPIPMLLTCPRCGDRHIDEGEFATKPHHTHACQNCGLLWRPALTHTIGVRFLPGCKDQESAENRHLRWIHDRLLHVHGENPNVDYMLRLRAIAKVSDPQPEPTGTLALDGTRMDGVWGDPEPEPNPSKDYDQIPTGDRIFCLLGVLRDKIPAEVVEAFQELARELNGRVPRETT